MQLREIMRPGPFTISETDTLGVAHAAMNRSHIRHLPVTSGGKLVGMLSERDVLAARAHADEQDWWAITVHDAMQTPVQTAAPDASLTEIAGRMAAAKIGAMPVVESGKLLGIATITDVLDAEVRSAMEPSSAATTTAADVMTPWPLTIRPEAPILDAITLMIERRVRHLPVVDAASTLVGMLSERDLRTVIGDPVEYLAFHCDRSTALLRVRSVMSQPVISVPFDRPLAELARIFADDRLGAVPVVDRFGALIGIVSYVDALRVLAR
jgi:acetoin utilization protein AcuB